MVQRLTSRLTQSSCIAQSIEHSSLRSELLQYVIEIFIHILGLGILHCIGDILPQYMKQSSVKSSSCCVLLLPHVFPNSSTQAADGSSVSDWLAVRHCKCMHGLKSLRWHLEQLTTISLSTWSLGKGEHIRAHLVSAHPQSGGTLLHGGQSLPVMREITWLYTVCYWNGGVRQCCCSADGWLQNKTVAWP